MANVKFNRTTTRSNALSSKDSNKVFFPTDGNAVIVGGKEYGMAPAAVRSSAPTLTTGGTTAGRYYGVEKGSDGTAFVNVPWNNTTYTNAALGQGYGTCTTAASTVSKVVTLTNYALVTGGVVVVRFTNAVPAGATLNVNSKGAKAIFFNGAAITAGIIKACDTVTFIYNGSYYHVAGIACTAIKEIDVSVFFGTGGSAPTTNTYITQTGGYDEYMYMHSYFAVIDGKKTRLNISVESSGLCLWYFYGMTSSGLAIDYVECTPGSSALYFKSRGSRNLR